MKLLLNRRVIILIKITNLNQLNKSLKEYEIGDNSLLLPEEKEVQININKEEVTFSSDQRTGIKYGVELLLNYDEVELKHMYIEDNAICHISLKMIPNFISMKSNPRRSDSVSNIFSMPSAYKNNSFFNQNTS